MVMPYERTHDFDEFELIIVHLCHNFRGPQFIEQ